MFNMIKMDLYRMFSYKGPVCDLDCTGSGCVIYNQYVQGRSAVYSGGISGE